MAMTAQPSPTPGDLIDGYTVDQLSDYLETGMTPPDPAIDSSPACQLALDTLRVVEAATAAALEREANELPPPDLSWLHAILDTISVNVRPGRTIPLPSPIQGVTVTTTESAVRGLVRAVGDETPGVIVGRCTLEGDVTEPGAPLRLRVDAATYWGRNIPHTADHLRDEIARAIRNQTDLAVTRIDVTVHDVHTPPFEMATP